jgi:hypothetical protein
MTADAAQGRGRPYTVIHYATIVIVIASILLVGAAIGLAIHDQLEPDPRVSPVLLVADGSKVPGASTVLKRNPDLTLDITVQTSGLPLGHVIVLEALVFNQPKNCTHGAPGVRCGAGDLADPAVDGSAIFLAASRIGSAGPLRLTAQLRTGDVTHAASGNGVTNPHGADVHLILVDHGPPVAGLFDEQMTTIGGGCKNPPPNAGTPGPNDCPDLQYSIHQ